MRQRYSLQPPLPSVPQATLSSVPGRHMGCSSTAPSVAPCQDRVAQHSPQHMDRNSARAMRPTNTLGTYQSRSPHPPPCFAPWLLTLVHSSDRQLGRQKTKGRTPSPPSDAPPPWTAVPPLGLPSALHQQRLSDWRVGVRPDPQTKMATRSAGGGGSATARAPFRWGAWATVCWGHGGM